MCQLLIQFPSAVFSQMTLLGTSITYSTKVPFQDYEKLFMLKSRLFVGNSCKSLKNNSPLEGQIYLWNGCALNVKVKKALKAKTSWVAISFWSSSSLTMSFSSYFQMELQLNSNSQKTSFIKSTSSPPLLKTLNNNQVLLV